MKYKKILAISLVSFAMLIVVGCGKEEVKTIPDKVVENNTEATIDVESDDGFVVVSATTESLDKTTNTNAVAKTNTETPASTETQKTVTTETKVETKKEEPKKEETPAIKNMLISSPAFNYGGTIPSEYTCNGTNVNPQLNISDIPSGTKSLALIMDDPDAPSGTWDHWLLWNIDPKTTVISKNSVPTGAKLGYNSWSNESYGGPCPPSGTHRYFFKLYALDTMLSIPSSNGTDLATALSGHILKQVSLMGKVSK